MSLDLQYLAKNRLRIANIYPARVAKLSLQAGQAGQLQDRLPDALRRQMSQVRPALEGGGAPGGSDQLAQVIQGPVGDIFSMPLPPFRYHAL